jgi:hypothetical protein
MNSWNGAGSRNSLLIEGGLVPVLKADRMTTRVQPSEHALFARCLKDTDLEYFLRSYGDSAKELR